MEITCSRCGATYRFDAALIPASGYDAQCTSCGDVFFVAGAAALTISPATPSTFEQQTKAQQAIAEAMVWALGMWFVPIPVVGSVACNTAETDMVRGILVALDRPATKTEIDRFFWYFRKKYFLVNVVTFLPYVGATVQLLEVYALGQFVLTCLDDGIDIHDDAALARAWSAIEPKIWRADDIVLFYETTTGKQFPPAIKGPFCVGVHQIGEVAQDLNRIPGFAKGQEVAGEALRQGQELATAALREGKELAAEALQAGFTGIKKLFS